MKKLTFLRYFRTRIEKDKPASEWTLDETGIEEVFIYNDAKRQLKSVSLD